MGLAANIIIHHTAAEQGSQAQARRRSFAHTGRAATTARPALLHPAQRRGRAARRQGGHPRIGRGTSTPVFFRPLHRTESFGREARSLDAPSTLSLALFHPIHHRTARMPAKRNSVAPIAPPEKFVAPIGRWAQQGASAMPSTDRKAELLGLCRGRAVRQWAALSEWIRAIAAVTPGRTAYHRAEAIQAKLALAARLYEADPDALWAAVLEEVRA